MKFKGEWELYNIEEDRTEQNNLVKKNPLVAQMLIRQWEDWAATTFVDEWIGKVRNDWGEEPKPAGNAKQSPGAKKP
jgi:arylsulfatase